MTTTETTPTATIIEHLGKELQVQLLRAEEEGKKDWLALQHLAGGAGRRIEVDSPEAQALAERHHEVAQLLAGPGTVAAPPPYYNPPTE
jgi:hypothetical protein